MVHPNEAGYAVMKSLIQPAIKEALTVREFTVYPFFSNHMVLQQNENVEVWGTASEEQFIKVRGNWGEEVTTITDKDGKWNLTIKTPQAGGPFVISIASEIFPYKLKMSWWGKFG